MLSGGLDSVAALAHLLRETDEPVHAHHIRLLKLEGRHDAEKAAVERVRAHLAVHHRPFRYTESTFDARGLGFNVYDTHMAFNVAELIMWGDPSVARVMTGRCAEDDGLPVGIQDYLLLLRAKLRGLLGREDAIAVSPFAAMTKAQEIEYLGPELAEATWSCRSPVYFDGRPTPCGNCRTCGHLNIR